MHAAGARVPTIVPSSIALTNSIGTPRAESGTHNPHEVLQRLREDHVVWLYSIVAARLGSPPRVLADGPVVDPSGMKEVARGPSWQELHTLRRDLLLLTDSRDALSLKCAPNVLA